MEGIELKLLPLPDLGDNPTPQAKMLMICLEQLQHVVTVQQQQINSLNQALFETINVMRRASSYRPGEYR